MTESRDEFLERLDALIDGELPEDEARVVRERAAQNEAYAAYLAEASKLGDALQRLDLVRESPRIADAVLARIHRRAVVRNVLLAAGLVALKVLDVGGVFGSGVLPRVIIAAAVVTAFIIMRINPFRLIQYVEPKPQPAAVPIEGDVS